MIVYISHLIKTNATASVSSGSELSSNESTLSSSDPIDSSELPSSSEVLSSSAPVSSGGTSSVEETYHPVPLIDAVKPVPKRDAVDDSYFNDAIFIGDSRTEGFILYSGLSGTTAYTHRGLMVNTIFTQEIVDVGGAKKTIFDALRANPDYSKIYIMLGTNELGWPYGSTFIEAYGKVIDELKSINPNAKIYVQSIIPVTANKSNSDKIYNNTKIEEFNALIQQMTVDKNVYYVNVSEALVGADGCLPDGSTFDGVHLNAAYCGKWLQYLKTHTVD